MSVSAQFTAEAAKAGISFYTGVPCSFLSPLTNAVISDHRTAYLGATSEGEAVAIAAGAWLAGRPSAAMMQNSGLGNAVNPLTSLNWPFRIPLLLVVSWRAEPGVKDEPQHELMGQITPSLLDLMGVPHAPFPDANVEAAMGEAVRHMEETGLPFAFVLSKGALPEAKLVQEKTPLRPRATAQGTFEGGDRPRRMEAIERLLARVGPEAAVIATTGYCGRELFTLGDAARNLYVVGSMGGASAIGLGASLHTKHEIVVLDGDGAALMKLGNFATIGAAGPANLTHIVLDNEMHESTGGQFTVSNGVDFAEVAAAAGYAQVARADSLDGMEAALGGMLSAPGPRFLHCKLAAGTHPKLGRPDIPPPVVARRFRDFLAGGSA